MTMTEPSVSIANVDESGSEVPQRQSYEKPSLTLLSVNESTMSGAPLPGPEVSTTAS